MASLRAAALLYARCGWQVVPLNTPTEDGCSCQRGIECGSPGKHPRVKWKEHGGSTDPLIISRWWRRWPNANVAILTGAGRSNLFVLDIDPRHGGEQSLSELERRHKPLPLTLTGLTGSGGRHLVFRRPEEGAKQGAGDLGLGLDTRSDGGLIVAPPSVHACGGVYRWENWGVPIADVPAWLLDLLRKPEPVQAVRIPVRWVKASGMMDDLLQQKADAVARSGVGERSNNLNATAFFFGRFVGAGMMDRRLVEDVLLRAALSAGLGEVEAGDTIESGLAAGEASPRKAVG